MSSKNWKVEILEDGAGPRVFVTQGQLMIADCGPVTARNEEIAKKISATPNLIRASKKAWKWNCGCRSNVDRKWHGRGCFKPLIRRALKKAGIRVE